MENNQLSKTLKKHREKILLKSLDLFLANGINQTTIQMIAKATKVTKKTIFNHFQTKDILATELQMMILEKIVEKRKDVQLSNDHVVDRIRSFLKSLIVLSKEEIKYIKYITMFDFYYVKGYPTEQYKEFIAKTALPTHLYLKDLIQLGQLQGFIKNGPDYDVLTLTLTLIQSTYAYIQRFHYRQDAITEEGFPDFMGNPELLLNILMDGILVKK
jgi:AcrR family transcriptional regulator